jgi:large repetitive protein
MNRGKRTSRRTLSAPRYALERLEDRTLLSGNVTATVTSGGNLLVVGDSKGNQIAIQTTSGALQVSSLDGTTTINGGSGPFTPTGFTGDVDVFMRQGADVVDVGGSGDVTSLPHNLVIDTGTGNDTVAVENASIGGNLAIFGGAGSDTFTVGSSSSETAVSVGGNVFIVGGTGSSNTIAVFDADITGDLRIFSSGLNDQIQVGFDAGLGIIGAEQTAHVNIGGDLNITTPTAFGFGGGSFGFDDFSMGRAWNNCGLDSAFSSLLGSRSFACSDAGKDLANDLAFLRGWCGGEGGNWCGHGNPSSSSGEHISVADVSVTGNTKINTGNGDDQILLGAAPVPSGDTTAPLNLVFGPVTISGNLAVTAGNGANTVLLDGISVTGNTSVTTGKGVDQIAILGNDGVYTGSFSINSGSGADKIAMIDGATFLSSVSVKSGRGADVMWVAGDLFMGSVTFNGGQGSDTLLQSETIFPNSFTPGNPVLTSIEVNMPDVSPTDAIVTTNFGWLNTLLGV